MTNKQVMNIGVIGVGFMGASLIKAIRKKYRAANIIGICRSTRTFVYAKRLKELSYLTNTTSPELIGTLDVVILSSTIFGILKSLDDIKGSLKSNALVMDVGSTKRIINIASKKLPKSVDFIGCHPMAGSEKRGPEHADASIFKNAICFISKKSTSRAQNRAKQFWKSLGSKPVVLDDRCHDALVARISHLPHVVATVLINSAGRINSRDLKYAGKGLSSMLRIAGSNPNVWNEILVSNRDLILEEIDSFVLELLKVRNFLKGKKQKQIVAYMEQGAKLKNKMLCVG